MQAYAKWQKHQLSKREGGLYTYNGIFKQSGKKRIWPTTEIVLAARVLDISTSVRVLHLKGGVSNERDKYDVLMTSNIIILT